MKVTQNPSINSQSIENQKHIERAPAQRGEATTSGSEALGIREGAAVDISENAKLMKAAVEKVQNTPDKRADRVAELKKQIREGTYRPDSAQIADRLVDEHLFSDYGKNRV